MQNTFPQLKFSVFSYPRGQVKPRTKEIVQKYYKCARGISPGINIGRVDLNLLKGTRIYGGKGNFGWIKKFIDHNRQENGWLIFYTHDVCALPTQYGCTPDFFEDVLRYSKESGAVILTVEEAYKKYVHDESL